MFVFSNLLSSSEIAQIQREIKGKIGQNWASNFKVHWVCQNKGEREGNSSLPLPTALQILRH